MRFAPGSAPLADLRVRGILRYLDALWRGDWTPEPPGPAAARSWPGHDPDPAVLLRDLAALGPAQCRIHLPALVGLIGHNDERIGKLAGQLVRRHGQPADAVAALGWLDEPRVNARPGLDALLVGLDLDRIEEAARMIVHQDSPSPARLAWALEGGVPGPGPPTGAFAWRRPRRSSGRAIPTGWGVCKMTSTLSVRRGANPGSRTGYPRPARGGIVVARTRPGVAIVPGAALATGARAGVGACSRHPPPCRLNQRRRLAIHLTRGRWERSD